MSKLDDILNSVQPFDPAAHTQPTTKEESKQQIKSLFSELIGKDVSIEHPEYMTDLDMYNLNQNDLREILRNKVADL